MSLNTGRGDCAYIGWREGDGAAFGVFLDAVLLLPVFAIMLCGVCAGAGRVATGIPGFVAVITRLGVCTGAGHAAAGIPGFVALISRLGVCAWAGRGEGGFAGLVDVISRLGTLEASGPGWFVTFIADFNTGYDLVYGVFAGDVFSIGYSTI